MRVARRISATVRERGVVGVRVGAEAVMLVERTAHVLWRWESAGDDHPAGLLPPSPLSARMMAAELHRGHSRNVLALPSRAYCVGAPREAAGMKTDAEPAAGAESGMAPPRAPAGHLFLEQGDSSRRGRELDLAV